MFSDLSEVLESLCSAGAKEELYQSPARRLLIVLTVLMCRIT